MQKITKEDKNILWLLLQEYLDEMSNYYDDILKDEDWSYHLNEFVVSAIKWAKAIAEFYIKKEYRKQWLWKKFAFQVFWKTFLKVGG